MGDQGGYPWASGFFLGPQAKPGEYSGVMTADLKGWVFLAASFLFLLVICGLAMVGLLTRPVRWSERV